MDSNSINLILASASPRRRELLGAMGVDFKVHATNTDESRLENEVAEDFVVRLARDKALQAAKDLDIAQTPAADNHAILAADTIVVQGQRVFGKPRDYEHAKRILMTLSANQHQVMTALCLQFAGKSHVKLVVTDVEFSMVTDAQIERYWRSGEPQDKAGAYGIQGLASAWVKQIHGSYTNVVGLPLREVNQLLSEINLNWL